MKYLYLKKNSEKLKINNYEKNNPFIHVNYNFGCKL